MKKPSPWTVVKVAILKAGLVKGLTFQEIAVQLGDSFTRSMVAGKVSRDKNLSSFRRGVAVSTLKTSKIRDRENKGDLRREEAKFLDLVAQSNIKYVPSTPKNLADLSHHECRWPVESDGSKHLFCGQPTLDSYPYCPYHCLKSRRVLSKKKKEENKNGFGTKNI